MHIKVYISWSNYSFGYCVVTAAFSVNGRCLLCVCVYSECVVLSLYIYWGISEKEPLRGRCNQTSAYLKLFSQELWHASKQMYICSPTRTCISLSSIFHLTHRSIFPYISVWVWKVPQHISADPASESWNWDQNSRKVGKKNRFQRTFYTEFSLNVI